MIKKIQADAGVRIQFKPGEDHKHDFLLRNTTFCSCSASPCISPFNPASVVIITMVILSLFLFSLPPSLPPSLYQMKVHDV
jgi:hypothetical protein